MRKSDLGELRECADVESVGGRHGALFKVGCWDDCFAESREERRRKNGKQFLIRRRIGEQWSSSAPLEKNNWLIEREE